MKSMLVLFAAIAAVCGCRSTRTDAPHTPSPQVKQAAPVESQAAKSGTPGVFDYYLFTLSWSPEFCSTHPQSPECPKHLGFIVHGLWPQNTNGSYPENCSNAPGPTNPASWTDIFPDTGLIAHEWQTHGTCSGLAADAYFALARRAFHEVAIPTQISSLRVQTSLAPAVILADFARANPGFPKGSVVLACGNNFLTAAEVCLSKSLQPMACPAVHSCGATSVKILPEGTGE